LKIYGVNLVMEWSERHVRVGCQRCNLILVHLDRAMLPAFPDFQKFMVATGKSEEHHMDLIVKCLGGCAVQFHQCEDSKRG
jgi:hypothetical protein